MADAESPETEIKWEWVFDPKEVPTLCFMAAAKIIQSLWRNKILEKRRLGDLASLFIDDQPSYIDLIYRTIHVSWTEPEEGAHLKVSRLYDIQFMMQKYAYELKNECEDWARHILYDVFFKRADDEQKTEILERFDDFVYDVNGWIDDISTAKKMLTCDKLNAVEQFTIACSYCLEDEIRRLWPIVSTSKEIEAEDYTVMNFWTRTLTNRTSEMRCSYFQVIFEHCTKVPAAKMYFFDEMIKDVERKKRTIGDAFYCLYEDSITFCARTLFPKLDDNFFKDLIRSYGSLILARMVVSRNDYVFLLPFWLKVKDWISREEFAKMFEEIIRMTDELIITWETPPDPELSNKLVEIIWGNASSELKEFASDYFRRNPALWDEFNWLLT